MKLKRLLINKRQECILLTLNFVILYLAYNLFQLTSYTSDHINGYLTGGGTYTLESFLSGRAISVMISYVQTILFGMNTAFQPYIQLFNVFLLSIACTIIATTFLSACQKDKSLQTVLLIDAFTLIGFVNPMFVEIFVYPGLEWPIGILAASLAAYFFTKENSVLAIIFLVVAVFVYQSYYSIFIIVVLTYIFLANDGRLTKSIIFKYVKAFVMVAAVCVFNLLYVQFFLWTGLLKNDVKSTALVINGFTDRMYHLIRWIAKLFGDCNGALPRFYMPIIMIILAAVSIYFIFKNRKSAKYAIEKVFSLGVVSFFIYFSVFFLGIVQSSGAYFPQRIAFPIFLALGSAGVIAYNLSGKFKSHLGLIPLVALILLTNFHYTQISILDFYTSNTLDRYYMDSMQIAIDEYEAKAGIEVKTIYAGRVDTSAYLYDKYIHMPYDLEAYNHKMPYYNWSDVELLNLFEDENYAQGVMPDEIFNEHFLGKNWDVFVPEEQLVFDGDKLYWVVF